MKTNEYNEMLAANDMMKMALFEDLPEDEQAEHRMGREEYSIEWMLPYYIRN